MLSVAYTAASCLISVGLIATCFFVGVEWSFCLISLSCLFLAPVLKRIYDECVIEVSSDFISKHLVSFRGQDSHDHDHHHHSSNHNSFDYDNVLTCSHYLIFNGMIFLCMKIASDLEGGSMILGDISCIILPFLIGGIFQGRPNCPAQKDIVRNRPLSVVVGGLNGLLCCAAQWLLLRFFESFLGEIAAFICAISLGSILGAKYMCAFESTMGKLFGMDKQDVLLI